MANSLLAYSDDEGPVKGYRYPLSDEAKAEIEKEKEEEEVGFDPMRAAALAAGASLLRNTGWSPRPMSLGQQIGHAIPHGMQAYYNQDALNQNEQAALYERQQAEQTALDAKLKLEDDARIQEQDQESFSQMMNELGLSVTEQKSMLRFYMKNPKEASAYLAKQIYEKKQGKGAKNKYEKIDEKERERLGLPKNVSQKVIPQDGAVPFYVDKYGTKVEAPVSAEDEVEEPKNKFIKIGPSDRLKLELPDTVYEKVLPQDGSVPFYIDKYGTKVEAPVTEEEKEVKAGVTFANVPDMPNKLLVLVDGEYKTTVTKPEKGVITTEDDVTETYNALLELDSSLEGQEKANALLLSGGTAQERHTALYEMIKAYKTPAAPEGKIDWIAAASNIYDKFSGVKNLDGSEKYNEQRLSAALSHPDPEQRYKNLEAFMNQTDPMAYKEFVALGGLKVREASLQQTKEQYANEQTKYIKREKHRLADEARKMNWGESRLMMAEESHDRKIRQMDKNWEDGKKGTLVSAKDWIKEKGGELPEGVAFVERRKVGDSWFMGRLINNDWTTYTAPLDNVNKVEVIDEIDRLFKTFSTRFDEKDRAEIKGLLFGPDPMEALKKAHAHLQEKGEKGIAPPASILKKYISDVGVRQAAKEALELLETDSEVQEGTGWIWGRVTEKFKSGVFQKFKALSTSASLAKRHELIGSQMTDGELKFTESMFPSNGDTLKSAKIKLQNLLRDSKFNLNLIHNMFTKEAGFNDAVWSEKGNMQPMTLDDMNK